MKLIEHNPFRMLGVPANATARDIAANKGKMRLLDVGKDVVFPLDLSDISPRLLSPIERTIEKVSVAERDINLPQDKIKYALFWFAQPSDPLGKLAYDHMLQGNIEKAQEIFKHSNSWESKLCLSTLSILNNDAIGAITAISDLIEYNSNAFVRSVVGQTYNISSGELRNIYLKCFCSNIGGIGSIKLCSSLDDGAIPQEYRNELRDVSIEIAIDEIDNEISAAKIEDKNDPEDNLNALNRLRWLTHSRIVSVREVLGDENPRFRHLSDRLAELLRTCSIRYYNAVHNSQPTAVTKKVVNTCLEIVEYAISICYGKALREKLDEDLKFLQDTKEKVLPDFVEIRLGHINSIIRKYNTAEKKTIGDSVRMMKECAPHVVLLKERPEYKTYYLSISTKIVDTALSFVIEEHNRVSKEEGDKPSPNENRRSMYMSALKALLMMDEFETEDEFKEKRYNQNRETLRSNAEKNWVDLKRFNVWIDFDEFDLRTEEEVYKDCCTSSDYQKYIYRYPNPKHRAEALEAMQRLYADEENRRREKEKAEREAKRLRDADNSAFIACKSLEDYRNYAKNYPRGIHISEARNAISVAEKKQKKRKKIGIWTAVFAGIALIITICGLIWGFENVLIVLMVLVILTISGLIEGAVTNSK